MTVQIHGKEYVMVNERIKEFREKYPQYSMESEIVKLDDDVCVIKAIIRDDSYRIVATGLAREERQDKDSIVNLNAFVENCETSAWGRALGNLGIGIDTAIASGDEMKVKISQELETLDDFKKAVENAKTEKQLRFLYYRWKEKFADGSEEFKELQKLSSARKIALGNPDLKVHKSDYNKQVAPIDVEQM